jgi:predicted ester cyclase
MSNEQNKTVVRRFWQAYEANDQVVLDAVLARTPGSPGPQNRERHLQGISMFNAAFSDRHFTVDEMIAEGDTVATRITMRGLHTGAFQGHPPTGRPMAATGLTLERIQDGRIVERWFSFDTARVLQELGLTTPPDSR